MIQYRAFHNSDPPALADIWRARQTERGLMQPMSASLFADLVLAKPYFDNEGLIVAVEGDRPVGFVHAGFGPNESNSELATDLGVTCMLLVLPDYRRLGIGTQLLSRSEAYLKSHGATVLYGGGIRPLIPFYLGLYGGSEMPGVLSSDPDAQRRYQAAGYEEIDRCVIFHRELVGFRPVVDRQQIQIRRRTTLKVIDDPPPSSWWDGCTYGPFDRIRFELFLRGGSEPIATSTTWTMEPLGMSWGVRAAGLIDVEVAPEHRRQGFSTYLIGEVLAHLGQEGFSLAEVQTMSSNEAARAMYEKLGFEIVDQGSILRKKAG